MYLITKWFGVFLCDKNGIKEKILFPNNVKSISNRMIKIEQGQILTEEKKITEGIKGTTVNETRLKTLGEYKPDDTFFKKFQINASEFSFSEGMLQKATILSTKNKVDEKLSSDDLQIVQMVNTLDDFIQTSNLLSERLESWSVLPTPKEKILPLKKAFSTVNEEIISLEKLIEEDMKKLAPNITSIAGPLVGARLIACSGSIEKLATRPSSTIQVLGAEKALFRFKKEGGKPPKHGVIFQHSLINRSHRNIRGKLARALAAKIAIAAKADAFTKRDISKELKKSLDKRIEEIKNL